ncbi:MAG: hypothetical protein KF690_08760 [Bacteroidetes bacterium]|nr:hypothetical protein [Bacteroidota bacterium]
MRKVCLVLDGGKESHGLVDRVLAWHTVDNLEVSIVLCPHVPDSESAPGAACRPGGAIGRCAHLGQDLVARFELLGVKTVRTCEGPALEVLSGESAGHDILIMTRDMFGRVYRLSGGRLTDKVYCPLFLPGPEHQALERTVLLCDPPCVEQTLQLLGPLLDGKELVLLNTRANYSPEAEKQLVRYVQTHFPNPAYYYTTHLEERDLRVVMKPNSLVSLTLQGWEQDAPVLQSLLGSAGWAHNVSIFFTV